MARQFAFWKSASGSTHALSGEGKYLSFNLISGESVSKATHPHDRNGSGAGVVSNMNAFYVAGGRSTSSEGGLNLAFKFDRGNEVLSQIGNLPARRSYPYTTYNVDGGYFCGGSDWTSATSVAYNSTFRLDYGTDVWSTKGNMPWTGKDGFGCNDHVRQFGYIGGGWVANTGPVYRNNVAKLSFATEVYFSWSQTFNSTDECVAKINTNDFGYFHLSEGSVRNYHRISYPSDTFVQFHSAATWLTSPGISLGMSRAKGYFNRFTSRYDENSNIVFENNIFGLDFSTETFSVEMVIPHNGDNDIRYMANAGVL